MKDMLGQDLELGDKVAYPASVAHSMKSEMVVGILEGYVLGRSMWSSYWDFEKRQRVTQDQKVPKYKIRPIKRSRSAIYCKTVMIENTSNLLKVN